MLKALKKNVILLVCILGILFLLSPVINATEFDSGNIYSADALKAVFEGKNATITGTTITLTEDVEFSIFCLTDEDYILDLNGHTLKADEFYVSTGALLTINDSTGKGKIDSFFMIEEGGEAVINNGRIGSGTVGIIDNSGTLTINNGTFHSIWNFGTLTINDGSFVNISTDEGALYINGGVFNSYKLTEKLEDGTIGEMDYFSMFNVKNSSIVITGGEFKAEGIKEALRIYGNNEYDVGESSINDIIGKGYLAEYKLNEENCTSWEMSYSAVRVIKDDSEAILNKLAPNGTWTIKGAKPENVDESESLLTSIANDIDLPKGYEIQAWCNGQDNMTTESVHINICYNGRILLEKDVSAIWKEPSKTVINNVTPVIKKIADKIDDEYITETGFVLEDLYLINYLNAEDDEINDSQALNFAKDLIKLTNGSDISYKFDFRCGDSGNDLWSFLGGTVIVYYNGIAVDTTKIGLNYSNVIYVPSDTENTDEARIEAALKRIGDYLGTTKGITLKVSGTLESLTDAIYSWNEYGLIDEKTSGSNYYNLTINGKTYKFAICKKAQEELETPKYIGNNLESNISITSNDTTIPLDTAITVEKVENETIKETLGTNTYTAYDISLYSNAKQVNITKIENGKFEVNIPVPENLKDKELAVYYIPDSGEKEEHDVEIKDGIAIFETDHFSTYALAEKVEDKTIDNAENVTDKGEKDDTPKMGEQEIISYVILTTMIAGVGVISLKRKH